MPLKPRRWTLPAAALALGCIGDLAPREIVVSPRILDIVAEPPEVAPGGTVRVRAFVGGNRGPVSYRWVACTARDPFSGGTGGFGTGTGEEGCTGDAGITLPLGTADEATLTIPAGLIDVEALLARIPGAQRSLAERYIRDVGLIVGVGLTIEADGRTVLGYKRVVVSLNPRPNRNPPTPRVRVNGRWVSVPGGGGDECAPEEGGPIRVPRAQNVGLAPDPTEAWLERYTVLTAVGTFEERTEQAFYSWYATDGEVARGLTRSPTRDNVWQPSATPGARTLWFFVRDGHGGTSGCRLPVTVD